MGNKQETAAPESAANFALDTTGSVMLPRSPGSVIRNHLWSDLAPFTQGYVEALFASAFDGSLDPLAKFRGFSDLAPETLALILRDCEAKTAGSLDTPNGYEGGRFWQRRQAGEDAYFPPLTPYLGDDGKVHLSGAA
jgi:hypothetical protein